MKSSSEKKVKKSEQRQITVSDSLAIKYRPQKIEDMIGNATAKTAIGGMLSRKKFANTLLLHGGTGMGKCVVGGTIVSTATGLHTIKSLVTHTTQGFGQYLGPGVINIHGQLEQPHQGYKKTTGTIVTLETEMGTELSGTPEHPVFAFKATGEFGFFRMAELKVGDYIGHAAQKAPTSYEFDSEAYTLGMLMSCDTIYHGLSPKGECLILHWINSFSNPHFAPTGDKLAPNVWAVPYANINHLYSKLKALKTADVIGSNDYCRSLLKGLFAQFEESRPYHFNIKLATVELAKAIQIVLMHFGVTSHREQEKLIISGQASCTLINVVSGKRLINFTPSISIPYHLAYHFYARTGISLSQESPAKAVVKLRKRVKQDEEAINFLMLLRNGMLFSPIQQASRASKREIVYDLSMPTTYSFVANGIVNHNTTMARMLARYINCEQGTACGECSSCRIGDASPDIHELNMATERGIDEIRTLISKSKLAPRFNKRIFILDELHQCTPQAKEALLKPLEEPPKNTMWILCTTDPQKLTKTILGRCQQISVTPPEQKEMVKYLIKVAKAEGIKVTEERLPILKHIAQMSMGHSRNALQMLETFINLLAGDKNISVEELNKMLATSMGEDNDETAAQLLACILAGKGQSAIKLLYQVGQNKEIMGMIFKLRWLIDFKLNSWAGTMKFNPTINQLFVKHYGAKKSVNPVHLIQILATLVDCEVHIKTVSGLDERIYFSSKILNDMVRIVNESKE